MKGWRGSFFALSVFHANRGAPGTHRKGRVLCE